MESHSRKATSEMASMSRPGKREEARKVSRRRFLKAGAASLGAAALVRLPHHGFGRAPPAIKGTWLAILQPTYFVAAAQDFFAWWRLQEGYQGISYSVFMGDALRCHRRTTPP